MSAEPMTEAELGTVRSRAAVLLPGDPVAWTNLTVDRLLATLDREREAAAALLAALNGLLRGIEHEAVNRPAPWSDIFAGKIETAAAVLALFDAAPDAPGLDVERLARAMCLANGDTPEQAEKFYDREIEEATAIAAEYAALATPPAVAEDVTT